MSEADDDVEDWSPRSLKHAHRAMLKPDGRGRYNEVQVFLDVIFRDFLKDVSDKVKDTRGAVEAHIQVVIWGSLYVEALANRLCRELLEEQIDQLDSRYTGFHRARTYWGVMKRSRVEDKVEMLVELGGGQMEGQDAAMKQELRRLFELRNRIVHFKDKPTAFDFDSETLLERTASRVPNPKLVNDLVESDYQDRRSAVLSVGDWLCKCYERAVEREE